MASARPFFRHLALALLATGVTCAAQATDRITDVANAHWTQGAQTREIASNTVVLDVVGDTLDLSIFRADPGSSQSQLLTGASCSAATGAAASTNIAIGVSDVATMTRGDLLVLSLDAPGANRDHAKIDTIDATVAASLSGDREMLKLHETGVDTGHFTGSVLTQAVQPTSPAGDCTLGLAEEDKVVIDVFGAGGKTPIATQTIGVPVDPRGKVFDSNNGGPVNGARVTLVDAATGAPAEVFAPDLKTAFPSTVISGQPVTDAGGTVYKGNPGLYQFPRVRPGQYRLIIAPPAPYTAPSTATPAELAHLLRPNGKPFTIVDGCYGKPFAVDGSGVVRIDIPVDPPATPVVLAKTASRASAAPGDVIIYTISVRNPDATHVGRNLTLTDTLPPTLRLRAHSARLDGVDDAAIVAGDDGHSLRVALSRIPPGATSRLVYAAEVRADAPTGATINRVAVTDPSGFAMSASAAVRITAETIAARMTVVGRVTDGPCAAEGKGVPGVRLMLEDGSYAVTDRDGRYHFDGLIPGTHVVQADPATLAAGGHFVNCARDTRAAGSATSRFVEGGGGAVVIADFKAVLPGAVAPVVDDLPVAASDKAAAGAEREWFANGSKDDGASIAWLFPEAEHNPRAPAVRIAIPHLPGQSVALLADGKPVDAIAFDGTRASPDGRFAVSLWRGVPLVAGVTHFSAVVHAADGKIAGTLTRDVHFVTAAARAEYLPARSRLLADGVHRPLLAVRLTDHAGRPVHAGSVGDFALSQPYEAAQAIDAEQARVLSGWSARHRPGTSPVTTASRISRWRRPRPAARWRWISRFATATRFAGKSSMRGCRPASDPGLWSAWRKGGSDGIWCRSASRVVG